MNTKKSRCISCRIVFDESTKNGVMVLPLCDSCKNRQDGNEVFKNVINNMRGVW